MQDWAAKIEKEYPNTNFDRLTSGSGIYNNIRFNLLSDKYFIPFFETSFTDFSPRKHKGIEDKIVHCFNKDRGNGNLKRLKFYLSGVFTQERGYKEAIEQIKNINKQREELYTALNVIKTQQNQLTISQLNAYKTQFNSRSSSLLPSEVNDLILLIDSIEWIATYNDIRNKWIEITALPNNNETFRSINNFVEKYDNKLKEIERNHKTKSDELRNSFFSKVNEVTFELMADEEKQFNEVKSEYFRLNEFFKAFISRYKQYRFFEHVDKMYSKILQEKLNLTRASYDNIQTDVLSSNDLEYLSDRNKISRTFG